MTSINIVIINTVGKGDEVFGKKLTVDVEAIRPYLRYPKDAFGSGAELFPAIEGESDAILRIWQGRHQDINLRHRPEVAEVIGYTGPRSGGYVYVLEHYRLSERAVRCFHNLNELPLYCCGRWRKATKEEVERLRPWDGVFEEITIEEALAIIRE